MLVRIRSYHVGFHKQSCRFFSNLSPLAQKRKSRSIEELQKLPEVRQRTILHTNLKNKTLNVPTLDAKRLTRTKSSKQKRIPDDKARIALTAAIATFHLHAESRVANEFGEGFYTIGPCGEEALAGVGLALEDGDPAALHYRHLSTLLARHLASGKNIKDLLYDRARGYCITTTDPVSGGHHCCLGGADATDIIVTSTLASQSTPAVGRAIGINLAHILEQPCPFPKDAISYVSVGDGSVNNAHFLSAINLSAYARHRGMRCPTVFGISDNQICISLRKGPVSIIFTNLARRFGHAATDRQVAYYTKDEIKQNEEHCSLSLMIQDLIDHGVVTFEDVLQEFETIGRLTEEAFDAVSAEPKISTRKEVIKHNNVPLKELPAEKKKKSGDEVFRQFFVTSFGLDESGIVRPNVMRKHMTECFHEILEEQEDVVYIGEDVRHGGYYLVSEGLALRHPKRVTDWPPDETSLLGAALGFSQSGLVPIVELPYAKYLDCGADMFYEIIIQNWWSASSKPHGMVIRLQGFDKGLFGGNFHTHNAIHLPPGLDVICASNGYDYVRMMRHAVHQARHGRVIMSVDSTALLNQRHLDVSARDDGWTRPYPATGDIRNFDEVSIFPSANANDLPFGVSGLTHPMSGAHDDDDTVIVTYGNGVPTALLAQRKLVNEHKLKVSVIDCPTLTSSYIPDELKNVITSFDNAVFADICKFGQHPQAGLVAQLQNENLLPSRWRSVAAASTYNPLGSLVTFLSQEDIMNATLAVHNGRQAGSDSEEEQNNFYWRQAANSI